MFNKQISKGQFKQRSETNTNPIVILLILHPKIILEGKQIGLEPKKNKFKRKFMVWRTKV